MLTDLKFWIDLAGVVMEVILLAYFMHILLGPMRFPWYIGAAAYLALGGCLLAISYGIELSYGRTVCYLLLISCSTIFFYRGQFWTKFFAGFCYILMVSMLEYVMHALLILVHGRIYVAGRGDLQEYILGLSISKCLALTLTQLLAEWIKKSRCPQGRLSLQNFCLLLGFPLITILTFFVLDYAFMSNNDLTGMLILLVITILFLVADIGIFVLFNRLTETARLEQEHAVAKQQIASQQQYYEALAAKNQSLRQWNHEIKNAFVVIAGYIQHGQLQESLDYIKKTEGYLSSTMQTITGNIALDAVLDNKQQLAESLGAELKCTIALAQTIQIEVADLVVVLANGLDNALEAVAKLPEPAGKVITCDMILQHNWFKIVITNPIQQRVNVEKDALPTQKRDTLRHGIGLTNVKAMAEKHHGQLKLHCDDERFTFMAVLANE